jgi:tripartite-type tricarboxylate transporter receptor subunit TctC
VNLLKLLAAALAAIVAVCAPAGAQSEYPARTITIVVPLTPGTTIDILARLFADKLARTFGQQVVVLNRPGAGGLIAAQAVANSAADGYTAVRQFGPCHSRHPEQEPPVRSGGRLRRGGAGR